MRKVISLIILILTVFSCISCGFIFSNATTEDIRVSDLKVGDTFTFGTYPQSEVADENLIAALNDKAPQWEEWTSYRYMSGTSETWQGNGEDVSNGSATPNDNMRYYDVEFDGAMYRGVRFVVPRSFHVNAKNHNVTINGRLANVNYWYKFEPIQWVVLKPNEGYVYSKYALDSQPFSNSLYWVNINGDFSMDENEYFKDVEPAIYANNYEKSDLRFWLNNLFYSTSFLENEQSVIEAKYRENKCEDKNHPEYDSATTNDFITLLSLDELKNNCKYLQDDVVNCYITDYSNIQGVDSYSGRCYWWMRSAGNISDKATITDKKNSYSYGNVGSTYFGVRPAMNIDPSYVVIPGEHDFEPPVSDTFTVCISVDGDGTATTDKIVSENSSVTIVAAPNEGSHFLGWFENGNAVSVDKYYTFIVNEDRDFVAKFEKHDFTEVISTKEATCKEEGYTSYLCNCGEIKITTPKTSHKAVVDNAVEPTCTEKGKTEGSHCLICGFEIAKQEEIPAKGHSVTEYIYNEDAQPGIDGSKTGSCKTCGKLVTVVAYGTALPVNTVVTTITIKDAKGTREVKADRNIVFEASVENSSGADIEWFVNGKFVGNGESIKISAKSDYEIYCQTKDEAGIVVKSPVEIVKVATLSYAPTGIFNGIFNLIDRIISGFNKLLLGFADILAGINNIIN